MPTRLGSLGNFPTEDLVTMLAEMGIETGIDPERTVALSREIAALLGIDPQSHRGNGATRKEVAELAVSNPNMRYS
jgi:hydroxymethylglutaryl-CoA lyase